MDKQPKLFPLSSNLPSRMPWNPLLWAFLGLITAFAAPGILMAEKGDSNIEQICLEQMGGEIQVNCRTRVNIISVSSGSFDYVSISTAVISSGTIKSFMVVGALDNSSPPSGRIGETITSTAGSTNDPTTGQYGDLTSISLSPGSWSISMTCLQSNEGGTWSAAQCGISTTTGNSSSGLTIGDTLADAEFSSSSATPIFIPMAITNYKVALSATTIYYLKFRADYSLGQPKCRGGRITAIRVF